MNDKQQVPKALVSEETQEDVQEENQEEQGEIIFSLHKTKDSLFGVSSDPKYSISECLMYLRLAENILMAQAFPLE